MCSIHLKRSPWYPNQVLQRRAKIPWVFFFGCNPALPEWDEGLTLQGCLSHFKTPLRKFAATVSPNVFNVSTFWKTQRFCQFRPPYILFLQLCHLLPVSPEVHLCLEMGVVKVPLSLSKVNTGCRCSISCNMFQHFLSASLKVSLQEMLRSLLTKGWAVSWGHAPAQKNAVCWPWIAHVCWIPPPTRILANKPSQTWTLKHGLRIDFRERFPALALSSTALHVRPVSHQVFKSIHRGWKWTPTGWSTLILWARGSPSIFLRNPFPKIATDWEHPWQRVALVDEHPIVWMVIVRTWIATSFIPQCRREPCPSAKIHWSSSHEG